MNAATERIPAMTITTLVITRALRDATSLGLTA